MNIEANLRAKEFSNLSPASLFGDLRLLRLRFLVTMEGRGRERLPWYLGSAWRGLIGWEMKGLCCPEDGRVSCTVCMARDHCPYFLLFERKSTLPGCDESPRGYIFYSPPCEYGRKQELHVTLIGPHTHHLPLLIKAMAAGRRSGLGAERVPYRITALEELRPDGTAAQITGKPGTFASLVTGHPLRDWLRGTDSPVRGFTVRFASPVRLRRKGVYLRDMDRTFLFSTLFRRLEASARLFSNARPLGRERWMELQKAVEPIGISGCRLKWKDLPRYSNRQGRRVPMGGLLGSFDVEDPSGLLYPWWLVASMLHVGKGASMGLGKVELHRDTTPR